MRSLAYYFDHREEILDELRQDEQFVAVMKTNKPAQDRWKRNYATRASAMRFHLDEHVDPAIAHGLRLRGIDVTTTERCEAITNSGRIALGVCPTRGKSHLHERPGLSAFRISPASSTLASPYFARDLHGRSDTSSVICASCTIASIRRDARRSRVSVTRLTTQSRDVLA